MDSPLTAKQKANASAKSLQASAHSPALNLTPPPPTPLLAPQHMTWSWALPSVSSCCTCSPLFLQSPSSMFAWQREFCCSSSLLGVQPLLHLCHPLCPGSPLSLILLKWNAIIFYMCPSWNHKLPKDNFMLDSSLCPQFLAQCPALGNSQEVFVKWITECKHRPNQMLRNALHPVREIFLALRHQWLYFGGYVSDFKKKKSERNTNSWDMTSSIAPASSSWCIRSLI